MMSMNTLRMLLIKKMDNAIIANARKQDTCQEKVRKTAEKIQKVSASDINRYLTEFIPPLCNF